MLVLLFLPWLPRGLLAVLAVLLLGGAVLMVNLVPENPYHTANLPQWQQGQFLNFNGATGTVALLWPFGAMIWAASVRRLRKPADDTPETQDTDKAS